MLDVKAPADHDVCDKLHRARRRVRAQPRARAPWSASGFGYDALAEKHPRLIWCGISGYGPDGPYRDKKAYDMLVQAEAGIIVDDRHGGRAGESGRVDRGYRRGLYAYSSILAALLNRGARPGAASGSTSRCSSA